MKEPYIYTKTSKLETIEDIKDKKVTVMGLGLNGGGVETARFLLKHGAFVTVTDLKDAHILADSINEIKDFERVRFVLGKHEKDDFINADVVIKNPGIKIETNEFLACAKSIETDISLFLRFTKAPIIAVTGSKGKSSTVSAIYFGLKACGFSAYLGGNITVNPLTFLHETTESTPVVLELSSWQLADLRGRGVLNPKITVITTIVPDHQNWYDGMESYVADKRLIYADQKINDYTICGIDTWGNSFASETKATVLRYSKTVPIGTDGKLDPEFCGVWLDSKKCGWARIEAHTEPLFILGSNLVVPGEHMRENVLNAALVLKIMGVTPSKIAEELAKFPGIHHRLEYFHSWKIEQDSNTEIRFYNDSAASIPEAAAAALNAFESNIHFLSGGTDKNLIFEPLANEAHRAEKIFLLEGTGTQKLIPLLNQKNIAYSGPYNSLQKMLETLKEYFIEQAQKKSYQGTTQIVVFAPGATSFGMFQNEFERGNTFKKLVKELF